MTCESSRSLGWWKKGELCGIHSSNPRRAQVVMRPKDVGRDGRSEVAAELLLVRVVLDIDEAFRMCVAKVRLMGRA